MGTRDLGKKFPIHYHKSNILHYVVQNTIKQYYNLWLQLAIPAVFRIGRNMLTEL
jgi:hypothetical protein